MPDVLAIADWNAVIAICAVLGLVAGGSRASYRAVIRYFDARVARASIGARLATVETAVKDIPAIKSAVETLVADGRTNGGATAKDQNNRIERKLDQLLKDGR